jgi:hypothetical protein
MNKTVDAGDGRRYRTEIPNVVFTLGLSPYELTLYLHLKRTAGEQGECWKSTATLAKETCMSTGMVSKAKDALTIPRIELGKKPLIKVKPEENPHGGKARHFITLVDIWPDNFKRFTSSQDEVASSPHELASSYSEIASSPGEIKKEPKEEEPKKKEEIPLGAKSAPLTVEVSQVFEHWKSTLQHTRAKLTPERSKAIRARLRDGYSVEEIKDAIDGCANSPFHQGKNDQHKVHNDLTLICRNGSKLENFIQMKGVDVTNHGNGKPTNEDKLRTILERRTQAATGEHYSGDETSNQLVRTGGFRAASDGRSLALAFK